MEEITNSIEKQTDLKIIYSKLRRKVSHLNVVWKDYLLLFYSDETNIDILKRSGQTFFGNLQKVMFEDLILQISKLMDKKEFTKKKEKNYNLSFDYLIHLLNGNHYNTDTIYFIFQELETKYVDFNLWRDKRISHTDLEHEQGIQQLPSLPYEKVKNMIESINNFMNVCDNLLGEIYTSYENSYSVGDAKLLMARLKFANDFDKYRSYITNWKLAEINQSYFNFEKNMDKTILNMLETTREKVLGSDI